MLHFDKKNDTDLAMITKCKVKPVTSKHLYGHWNWRSEQRRENDTCDRPKEKLSPLRISVLCQDDFARPTFEIPRINDHVDWEVPESIDLARYYRHILKGREENDIVIAEGLFSFCDKHIYNHYDKKIFPIISKETFWRRKSKDRRGNPKVLGIRILNPLAQ